MVIGSAAMPLLRDLALLAGLSTYLFLVVTSVMLLLGGADRRRRGQERSLDGCSRRMCDERHERMLLVLRPCVHPGGARR
jgi:hypothetical protein